MKAKITMQSTSTLSVHDCFEKYIKKCTVKNLSDKPICIYRKHYRILIEYLDENSPISSITSDIMDDFTLYVKETHECNDIANSLLRTY